MFKVLKKLLQLGVLGINGRNGQYLLRYNPRRLYPLVDDKLQTKRLAEGAGIGVPELYGVVEIHRQIRDLPNLLAEHPDFVVKPSRGSGGDGILVIVGRSRRGYRKTNGTIILPEELGHHVANILSGMYSLGGQADVALIEYRVQPDAVFESISYQGVPDIRVIVFMGVPVMAMVRLPTRQSDGKANLHQGALGTGVDIATGKTLTAVWGNGVVADHPDTGNAVSGIQIPRWNQLLLLAARCSDLTGLGYQGADFVLDSRKGPLLLEVNARPGLNVQIANRAGLLPRLRLVEEHLNEFRSAEERVLFARRYFGSQNFTPSFGHKDRLIESSTISAGNPGTSFATRFLPSARTEPISAEK
ncbi:MAG: alpha-L-glutamate ligase-like protein [Deltaproteobacteria bacterium]|nr:alpha-L-glutamate ligase-like protein [Deltaproteobacteria bacterium]